MGFETFVVFGEFFGDAIRLIDDFSSDMDIFFFFGEGIPGKLGKSTCRKNSFKIKFQNKLVNIQKIIYELIFKQIFSKENIISELNKNFFFCYFYYLRF